MGSRMRKNKSQRDQRRSQLHAKLPRLSTDTETGSVHLRHRVDLKTGMYRGRQVLNVTTPANTSSDDQSSKSDAKNSKDKKADKQAEVSASK